MFWQRKLWENIVFSMTWCGLWGIKVACFVILVLMHVRRDVGGSATILVFIPISLCSGPIEARLGKTAANQRATL